MLARRRRTTASANWPTSSLKPFPAATSNTLPMAGPDKRCYRVNCDKIRRVLPSFRPQWTARKGAQELYDAYRAAGLTRDDLERGRYIRISHIQRLMKTGQLDASLRWSQQPPKRRWLPDLMSPQ